MTTLGRYFGMTLIAASAILSQACSDSANSVMGPGNPSQSNQQDSLLRERCELAPQAPDTVFASQNLETIISIAFRDNSDNEDGFWVYYARIDTARATLGWGTRQRMHVAAQNDPSGMVTAEITGLVPGSVYRILWVEAYNDAGVSEPSKHAMGFTTPAEERDELLPPAAPDTVFASVHHETILSIVFRDNANNEDGFWLYYVKIDTSKASLGYGTLQQMHLDACDNETDPLDLVTADITGLEPGSVYRVWVVAYNQAGESDRRDAIGGTRFDDERDELIVMRMHPGRGKDYES